MATEDWDAELAKLKALSEKELDVAIDALTRYFETRVAQGAPAGQAEAVLQLREAVKDALIDVIDGRVRVVMLAAYDATGQQLGARGAETGKPTE